MFNMEGNAIISFKPKSKKASFQQQMVKIVISGMEESDLFGHYCHQRSSNSALPLASTVDQSLDS